MLFTCIFFHSCAAALIDQRAVAPTRHSESANHHDHGIVSNSTRDLNAAFPIVIFITIALYNAVELACIIFFTFKKRNGLYFWSFCVATFGLVPYSVGFLLKGLGINTRLIYLYVTMIVIGWSCLVTGQSVVLYSRLHLVDRDPRHLRFVLAMVITNADYLPYSRLYPHLRRQLIGPGRVSITIFFLQELIISIMYIVATTKLFRDSTLHAKSARKRMLWHLILVNIVVILLDITILGLEYAGYYELQTAYKALVYSIKLKLEFNILNGLIDLSGGRMGTSSGQNDYIFDGSQRVPACFDSLPAMAMDTIEVGGTLQDELARKGAIANPEIGRRYSAHVQTGHEPTDEARSGTADGILIMKTTEVNIVRDSEIERQMKCLRRISTTSLPGTGSLELATTLEPGAGSASSSEIGFAKNGA
ncbi:hypothetical protein BN1723_006473 [Verticillium longisporum]|uniref:DUF7703 domain-containing protein n=1 Tax=Verticillium longisporum TaxID=100787 RepID=A0A0G4NFA7_VERLO|nr:hypothetical protein BN1723_006473 [Verticillium longisporum]